MLSDFYYPKEHAISDTAKKLRLRPQADYKAHLFKEVSRGKAASLATPVSFTPGVGRYNPHYF